MSWTRTLLWCGIAVAAGTGSFVRAAQEPSPVSEAPAAEVLGDAIEPLLSDDLSLLQDAAKTNQPKPAPPTTPKPGDNAPPLRPVQPAPNPFVNQPQQQFAPANRSPLARMSRAPDMFGDSYMPAFVTFNIDITTAGGAEGLVASLPSANIGGRFKNEYARALPTDRVFAIYHHFENVFDVNAGSGFANQSRSLDRYTLGFEKTFDEGNSSIELRLPLTGTVNVSNPDIRFRSENVGDLVVTLKRLLYVDESQGLAVGLSVSTPTGQDLQVDLPEVDTTVTFRNEAVYLLPFVAYQATPADNWFFNGYAQIDVAANPNVVKLREPQTVNRLQITDQTLLYLDASVGYWLFQNDESETLSGVAGLLELHYTTALNDPDTSSADPNGTLQFGSASRRFDVINMTVGTHWQFGRNTSFRLGAIFPLRDNPHRFFDSEITAALSFRR